MTINIGDSSADASIYAGKSPDQKSNLFLPFTPVSPPKSIGEIQKGDLRKTFHNHDDWRLLSKEEFEAIKWNEIALKAIGIEQPDKKTPSQTDPIPLQFNKGHFWGWFWSSTANGNEIYIYNIEKQLGVFVHPNDGAEKAQALLIRDAPTEPTARL